MIYQKVKTPDGIGEVVSIKTPQNGLYVDYNCAEVVVWYGAENSQNGKSSWAYPIREIYELNPSLKRSIKINNILNDKG